MRTTLTIEPDVAQKIRRRTTQTKLPLKRVVNDALLAGLSSPEREYKARYTVEIYPCQFKAGIDPNKLNHLPDELDAREFVRKMTR
jgi:hypothetical protein